MITCRLTLLLHPELDPLSVDNFVNFVHIWCQFHCFACKSACMIVPSGAPATMVGLGSTAQTSISPATPALARMGEDAIRLEPTDTSVTVHQVRNGFKDPKKVYWIQILCVCVCLYPPQSLAGFHLWVYRCQLSHSQHSLLLDFGPCPLRAALLKLTSLGWEIWCWHCPCTCLLCSTLEHMLDDFERHRLEGLLIMLNAHICLPSNRHS